MRRWILAGMALLSVAFFSLVAAADAKPQISLTEAFMEAPGEHPRRILLEGEKLRKVVDPGTSLYFPIENAQRAEDFSGLRAAVVWAKGEELAAYPRIEYRLMYDETGKIPLGYRYVVGLFPADGQGAASGTMQGEVKIAKRLNAIAPSVAFTISVRSKEQEGEKNSFRCSRKELWIDFVEPEEWASINFYDRARYVVSTVGQQTLNVGCSIEPLTDFVLRYPDAKLRFLYWTVPPVFDHEGTLTLYAAREDRLYRVVPGGLFDCSDLYVEEQGGFVIETRSLGEFVLSDRALNPQAPRARAENPPVGARP